MNWRAYWSARTRNEALGLLGAFLISILAAIVMTWPMIRYYDVIVMGGGELGGWLWRYDWHSRSLDGIMQTDASLPRLWEEFVSLGRHPETGNILDVLALTYPLHELFGFPGSYNIKILLILVFNGVSAYALGRYFSRSIAASLAAATIAIANPLCIQEIQACGLRQAILWWVLLYPALLDRALRRRTLPAGIVAGICFGVAGAFYWFYGLFTFIFTLVWMVKHATSERLRGNLAGLLRAMVGVGVGVALAAGPFILPYALPGEGGSAGGANQLPEMSFFVPFPRYDTIAHAALRPQTYAENVLASIHRTIGSSWSATYAFNPTLNEALPVIVLLFGVLPALWRRRSWGWLGIWAFFYLGTLGPFLRLGTGDAENVTRVFDDYVIRLPYAWMFQFIPGMSRMFAPYRLGSYVVVASVALVAIGVSRFRWRVWLAPLVLTSAVLQPMLRMGRGSVNEGGTDQEELRSPIKINRIIVPDYYLNLDRSELTGIIEVPVDQQQDLLYYYQVEHGQKVYKSWASPAAVPPLLRPEGAGGEEGERLRFQARGDVVNGPVPDTLQQLSRNPDTAVLTSLTTPEFQKWAAQNRYQRLIIHERGYYLVDAMRGPMLYQLAVEKVGLALGVTPLELEELRQGDPANPVLGVPIVGDLVPWSSQPADLQPEQAPAAYHMAVFLIPGLGGRETEANGGAVDPLLAPEDTVPVEEAPTEEAPPEAGRPPAG